jgi:hypothetical protein
MQPVSKERVARCVTFGVRALVCDGSKRLASRTHDLDAQDLWSSGPAPHG